MSTSRLIQLARHLADTLCRARRKLATAGVALLAALLAVHVLFGANGMIVYHKKRTEYRSLQNNLQQLEKENDALSQQIRALKSDPEAIEKEAREQLRYAKPGEIIFLLPAPKPDSPPPTASAEKR